MAMDPTQLATEIVAAVPYPGPPTFELIGFCTGLIQEIIENGTATSRNIPGPHSISGMAGSSMANKIALLAYPSFGFVSFTLVNFCNAIVSHIQDDGQVFYTSPVPANPPGPGDSWFLGGTISGLDGPTLADLIQAAVPYPGSTSPELISYCTAIVLHIQTNAQVTDGVIA